MSKNTANEKITPNLSLQHIQSVITLIDLCSKRGAFEGSELSAVGTIRESFSQILDFHTPKKEEDETSEATTEGAEATEETSE